MQGKVIEFWRAVEMFSPPTVPAARPSELVFEVGPEDQLPWDAGHPLRRQRLPKNLTWRHIVYLGIYRLDDVYEALKGVFPAEGDSFGERRGGSSALLSFAVSDEGTMLSDSAVLSACAWATGRALDPGPTAAGWLDGFDELNAGVAQQLEETFLGGDDEQRDPVVLDRAALAECGAGVGAALGVGEALGVKGIRVRSEKVGRQNAGVVEHDFLTASSPTTSGVWPAPPREKKSALLCATTCDRMLTSTAPLASMCGPGSTRYDGPPILTVSPSAAGLRASTTRSPSDSSSPSTRP